MHEYRIFDVTGDSAATLEVRLNELVSSGWMLDKLTSDAEGRPKLAVLMRVKMPGSAERDVRPS